MNRLGSGGKAPREARSAVKSADRVLDLFELLDRWGRGMSHSKIAESLGIPKSSLSQLLKSLVARGYIRYSAEGKSYHLGERIESLARRTSQGHDLTSLAQPTLNRIAEITRESAFLNMLHGDSAQLVARAIGPQPLVTVLQLGQLVPLYATAGGKAILAFLPEEMRNEYLSSVHFKPYTEKTVRSMAELEERLEAVRREGLCVSFDELVIGVAGIAVPILSNAGFSLGSLIVSMPTIRFDEQRKLEIAAILRSSAEGLRNRLTN